MNANASLKQYEENDLKYRFLKSYGNRAVIKLCAQTDSFYNRDKDLFTDQIITAEKRRSQIADSLIFAGEKKERKMQDLSKER
jgi:hypothetical protein